MQKAKRCFTQLDYQCSIRLLAAIPPTTLSASPLPKRVEIHRILAFAYGALDDQQRATEQFDRLLAALPTFTLNPKVISPRIYRAFRSALENRLQRQMTLVPAPIVKFTPPAPPLVAEPKLIIRRGFRRTPRRRRDPYLFPVEFTLHGGYLFLLGSDAARYQHGPLVGFSAAYRVIPRLLLRASARFSFHKMTESLKATILPNQATLLLMMRVHAGVGWQVWRTHYQVLELAVDLGAGLYGLLSLSGNAAFSGEFELKWDYLVTPAIRLGLIAATGLLLARGNPVGASALISASARVAFSF